MIIHVKKHREKILPPKGHNCYRFLVTIRNTISSRHVVQKKKKYTKFNARFRLLELKYGYGYGLEKIQITKIYFTCRSDGDSLYV